MAKMTSPYPDNAPSEWVLDWRVQPAYRADGMLAFEYAMYANERSRTAKDRPFLLNSHLAQVRETHQRIKLTPTGEYTHVSGLTVKPEDVEEFLATDSRANPTGLDPFMFPTYWGKLEALDPQWLRETYTLPQKGQVDELIERYLRGAEARRLSGDHRGTTLDLQVGAGADDGIWFNSTTFNSGHSRTFFKHNAITDIQTYMRFTSVTVGQDATIDVAYMPFGIATTEPEDTVGSRLIGVNEDNAAAPTSYADAEGRSRTSVYTDWAPIPSWTAGSTVNTPEIKAVIEEIVRRGGWTSGNALVLYTNNQDTAGDVTKTAYSYDGDSAKAPKLHIEYSEAAAAGSLVPPRRLRMELR